MFSKYRQKIGRIISKTTIFVLFLINISFICLILLAITAWYIPPYSTTIPTFLGLGFPVLLAVNILFLLFWIVLLRWKFVCVCLIALLFCLEPIRVYIPINFKSEVIPEDCLKILTYNVEGFHWATDEEARANPIFDYMKESNADIICLQEFVINNKKYNPDGIISIAELDEILDEYPYRSVVRIGEAEGVYSLGIACYSKYPIRKTRQIPIKSELNGAALYEIQINDKTLSLFNIHLESNRLTVDEKNLYQDFFRTRDPKIFGQLSEQMQMKLGTAYIRRAEHADMIAQWIAQQETDGTIVCGDFNDTPVSYAYHTIKKGDVILLDSYAETGLGQGITYHEGFFWFRIDYIFHTRNMQSFNCTVDKVKYSDHYPVHTYFRFKNK